MPPRSSVTVRGVLQSRNHMIAPQAPAPRKRLNQVTCPSALRRSALMLRPMGGEIGPYSFNQAHDHAHQTTAAN